MKVCTCSLIMDHIPRHLKPKIMQRQIKKRVPTNKWRWNESWILCLALCWPICLGLNILMTTFISDAGGFCWKLVSKLIKFQAIIRQDMNWHFFLMLVSSKGQLISKCIFGVFNFSKKRTKKFDLTTMIPQGDLFSFKFWKNLQTTKIHFEINWPLEV